MLRALADRLAVRGQRHEAGAPVRYFWPALLPRNALFLAVVLLHALRRLARSTVRKQGPMFFIEDDSCDAHDDFPLFPLLRECTLSAAR